MLYVVGYRKANAECSHSQVDTSNPDFIWGSMTVIPGVPDSLERRMMRVLTVNTESRFSWEVDFWACLCVAGYPDPVNSSRKTCPLWEAPFPRLYDQRKGAEHIRNSLLSASCLWVWYNHCSKLWLPWLSHHDRLHPRTVRQRKLFLP